MAIIKITQRMKWIVQQLKTHPDAVITHRRDGFMEKSFYSLDWTDEKGFHCVTVTSHMKKKLASAGLIEIVEERSVHTKGGDFVTTERDWGLAKSQRAVHVIDA